MLKVTRSIHGMPCIQLINPSPEVRALIRRTVLNQQIDTKAYDVRTRAGAFLQGDEHDWILIEFWQDDYLPFVDYLNAQIAAQEAQGVYRPREFGAPDTTTGGEG